MPVRGHGARPPARTGELLAVCAVAPGAGASTLSRLIAVAAADRGTGAIMLCHAAAAPEPRTPTTAAAVRRELLGLFPRSAPARAPRVIAVPAGASAARLGRKLARARSVYALTVV